MNELEKLLAKSKIVKIGDADVEVHSLVYEDLIEVTKLNDPNSDIKAQAMKDLIKKCLKRSFPDATDEQIARFDLKYLGDFLNAIFDVSGLEVDKKKLDQMMATF